MPLPSDEVLVQTGRDIVSQLQSIFGSHPGFRPAHAKGILLRGTFTPSPVARTLSSAPHFSSPSTPLLIRFSNSTGLPNIPDSSPDADPRGLAIRFVLGPHKHTDIVCHSTAFFPMRTGAGFLAFLRAAAAGTVPAFLAENPSALAFVTAPKPAPSSWAREEYFSVTAFKLVDGEGKGTYVRYKFVPEAGVDLLSSEELKSKGENYLLDELKERLAKGPVGFKLVAQVAEEGDVTDDATVHWPESRTVVELGHFTIETEVEDNAKEQKTIIFDPIPRVQGVEPSDDPLLEMRAAVYLISGKERRAAA